MASGDRDDASERFAAATDEDEFLRAVYDELRRMARHFLRGERDQRTLQTTALVHEAYLKLQDVEQVSEHGKAYFFGAAARAMRQILVDAARHRARAKRGGERPASLDGLVGLDPTDARNDEQVIWVHQALEALAEQYPRPARVVECRFFGGLSGEETAQVLGVSERTVKRDWSFAQAWLYRQWSG